MVADANAIEFGVLNLSISAEPTTRHYETPDLTLEQRIRVTTSSVIQDWKLQRHGCLHMFLHLGWGGVYMDAAREATKIRGCFAMADRLVQEPESIGKLNGDRRLTVVASDFYGSYWIAPGQKPRKPENSREKLTAVLTEARNWFEAYKRE